MGGLERIKLKKIDAAPAMPDMTDENAEQELLDIEQALRESFRSNTNPDSFKTQYHEALSDSKLCEKTLNRLYRAFVDKFGVTPDEFARIHGRGDQSGGLELQLFEMAKRDYLDMPGNNERSLNKVLGLLDHNN